MTRVIVVQKALQAAFKVLRAGQAATSQKAAGQDTEEQFGLMKPRAMFRRAMKDMAVVGITQKGPALHSRLQFVGRKGPLAPPRHHAADVQTPVGVQMVHDPIIMVHAGQALVRLCAMGHEIGGLTGAPHGPGHLPSGHGQRGDEDARAMAQVCMCSAFTSAWLGGFGRSFALEHVHAGFFLTAAHQSPLLVRLTGLGVQLADGVGFGLKVFIVAVQPGLTLVGLEIDVVQDAPNARAAARISAQSVEQGRHDRIQGPAGNGAILVLWQGAGSRDALDASGWGNDLWTSRSESILQTREAQVEVTPSPRASRAVVAAQLAADLQVGRPVEISGS